jgi:chromosome segregation ATPase
MFRSLFALAICCLLAAPAVQAQSVYRWVDDSGEVHYGQSVPPEFKDYGYVRLGPSGNVLERVEPALTPEQIEQRRRERAEQARLEAEERSREAQDRMLLATYRSEEDLLEARDMQLAGIQSQRDSTRKALELIENRFAGLIERAARLNRDGRTVPASLQQRIDETRSELRGMRADLDRLDEREQAVRDRFQTDLARYRELKSPSDQSG